VGTASSSTGFPRHAREKRDPELRRRAAAMREQGQGGLLCKGVTPRCDRIIVESEAQPLGGVLVESPGAFMSAKEGSGSACALRRRPLCLRRQTGLCASGFQPR